MASFDDPNVQPHTGPSVENNPEALQSSMPRLYRTKSPVSQTTKSLKSKRSMRPVPIQEQTVDRRPTLTPTQRFRTLVRKVMRLSHTSRCISGKGPGAEPGIDVRKDSASLSYGHIRQNCLIEVVDYSSVQSSSGRMTNREFISFLSNPTASERERWMKVRWINVGGISWDVVRALALKYGMSTPMFLRRDDIHDRTHRPPPIVPGGFASCPRGASFRCQLLQGAPFHPCP